jgi:hypothetical protein
MRFFEISRGRNARILPGLFPKNIADVRILDKENYDFTKTINTKNEAGYRPGTTPWATH